MIAFIMAIYYQAEEAHTPQQINKNISQTFEKDMIYSGNYTTKYYVSQYQEENMNVKNALSNIMYAAVYFMGVTFNSLFPYANYIIAGKYNIQIFWIAIIILTIFFWQLIQETIKFAICIYFFIKEKRKSKMKWYQ